ncbi:hypothetical protein [Phenylobacterium sp.]|uniref:hypothetical protein n=1 Tax=Phenylobacterium sp. TaxID=1871053 RepID=UPI0030F4119B
MTPDDLPSDDELHRRIVQRYGDAVGRASGPPIITDIRIGTKPPAPWKRAALFAVNDHRAAGVTITGALRAAYDAHGVTLQGGSSLASFKRSYERFRKTDLRDHFYASVLDGDLNEAIAALKFCHDETRDEIWHDLNGDLPPPPPR